MRAAPSAPPPLCGALKALGETPLAQQKKMLSQGPPANIVSRLGNLFWGGASSAARISDERVHVLMVAIQGRPWASVRNKSPESKVNSEEPGIMPDSVCARLRVCQKFKNPSFSEQNP